MDDSQARKFQKDLNAGLVALVLLAVLGYTATGLGHVSPVFHTNKIDLALKVRSTLDGK